MQAICLAVDGDHLAVLSLGDWLRQEPELRGMVKHLQPPPAAGELGSLPELVIESVVSGSVGAIAGTLGQSITSWLQQRMLRGDSRVSITVTAPSGASVILINQSAPEIEELLLSTLDTPTTPNHLSTSRGDAEEGGHASA
ncbi:hypothetical protein [Streptomyces sp. NBC_00638]|uniref:effector-associated constant component EACC1 n=1 Tax=Streptomyces sp. NBC_00638 TaxID=2975794 RepID=UPI00338F4908